MTLMVNSAKFTGRTMQKAIDRYMNHRRAVKGGQGRAGPVVHKGKQTVKQLTRQGQELSNVELTDPDMKQFDRIARKYGVDYAVQNGGKVAVNFSGGKDSTVMLDIWVIPIL